MVIDFVRVILQNSLDKIDIHEPQNIKSCTQTIFGLHKGQRPELFGSKIGLLGLNLRSCNILHILKYSFTHIITFGLHKGQRPQFFGSKIELFRLDLLSCDFLRFLT